MLKNNLKPRRNPMEPNKPTREQLREQSKLCTHCKKEPKIIDPYCLECANWVAAAQIYQGTPAFFLVLDLDPAKA
jgi:hypothetical protein